MDICSKIVNKVYLLNKIKLRIILLIPTDSNFYQTSRAEALRPGSRCTYFCCKRCANAGAFLIRSSSSATICLTSSLIW